MADSDSDEDKKVVEEVLPAYRIRYNDLDVSLVKLVVKGSNNN
jgi:hypothetical protein